MTKALDLFQGLFFGNPRSSTHLLRLLRRLSQRQWLWCWCFQYSVACEPFLWEMVSVPMTLLFAGWWELIAALGFFLEILGPLRW